MKNNIKSFSEFKKINESGWDSMDEDAGEIIVNGVSLDTTSVCIYDTPDSIAYEVFVNPTPAELVKIGIMSEKYIDEVDPRILIYSNGKDLTRKELKSMGAETVRDIEDSDIVGYFISDYSRKIPSDVITAEQFVELVKSVEYNEYEDLRLIDSKEAPAYRQLLRSGIFNKD